VLSEAAMGLAIDGAVQHEGRGDRVPSQRCEKRQGFPVAMRDLGEERLSAAAPAARAGHVGFGPGRINENKAGWVNPGLVFLPAQPAPFCQVKS
jgi:hypothetical protein